jgi:putative polyketide hydroxylase
VIPNGTSLPAVANPVTDYVPAARPASRALHIWLWRGRQRVSALDLYDTSFVLLAGRSGRAWCEAGEKAARLLGIPLACAAIAAEDESKRSP